MTVTTPLALGVATSMCARCGQPHPRCQDHRRGVSPLTPCMRWPKRGNAVCGTHGGNLPVVRRAGARRVAQAEAAKVVARFNARTDIDPGTALLELVQYQAGIVDYWRHRVEQVESAALEWSLVEKTEGTSTGQAGPGDTTGEKQAAGAHVAYALLQEAQDKLSSYASSALRAGVEERRVRVAEEQGVLFVSAQRRILERMFDAVLELARTGAMDQVGVLRRGWEQASSVVVPEEMRRLTAVTTP